MKLLMLSSPCCRCRNWDTEWLGNTLKLTLLVRCWNQGISNPSSCISKHLPLLIPDPSNAKLRHLPHYHTPPSHRSVFLLINSSFGLGWLWWSWTLSSQGKNFVILSSIKHFGLQPPLRIPAKSARKLLVRRILELQSQILSHADRWDTEVGLISGMQFP